MGVHERDPFDLAVAALRHRDRSRSELDERLTRAGMGEAARRIALDRLEQVGYIDDQRFAGARAGALANRGYGDEWIRHDLARHGVPRDDAVAAIAMLDPESERAAALADRLGRTSKTAAHLARKGFGEEAVAAAVRFDVAE
jgi:regulatory protein